MVDTWKRQSILQIVEKLDLNQITLQEAKQRADKLNLSFARNSKHAFIRSLLNVIKEN